MVARGAAPISGPDGHAARRACSDQIADWIERRRQRIGNSTTVRRSNPLWQTIVKQEFTPVFPQAAFPGNRARPAAIRQEGSRRRAQGRPRRRQGRCLDRRVVAPAGGTRRRVSDTASGRIDQVSRSERDFASLMGYRACSSPTTPRIQGACGALDFVAGRTCGPMRVWRSTIQRFLGPQARVLAAC